MPRFIPAELKAHLQGEQTTTTWLLKITPVTPGFTAYGVTHLNRDVIYDDGDGELTYLAAVGMQPSAIAQAGELSIDNAEIAHLLPEYDIPVSEADIRAGAYDYAAYKLYLVNYEDLTQGHVTLQAGTIGQVSIRDDGLSFINELRGLAAQLQQSVCEKDSLTCRAIFGSQPIDSATPGPQVAWGWCGFNAAALLQNGTVTGVGFEPRLTFSVTPDEDWADGHLAPGVMEFTSGLNAGRTFEISDNTAAGEITLAYETPYPVQIGDEINYRPDCNKHARDENKGCLKHWEAEWVLHFRGEPDIPIADEAALSVPGAGVGPGQGGTTNEPFFTS